MIHQMIESIGQRIRRKQTDVAAISPIGGEDTASPGCNCATGQPEGQQLRAVRKRIESWSTRPVPGTFHHLVIMTSMSGAKPCIPFASSVNSSPALSSRAERDRPKDGHAKSRGPMPAGTHQRHGKEFPSGWPGLDPPARVLRPSSAWTRLLIFTFPHPVVTSNLWLAHARSLTRLNVPGLGNHAFKRGVNDPNALRQKQNGPQALIEPAGCPVDCLGLTKRWSLYVASHGNSRVRDKCLRATNAMHPSILTG